MNKTSLELYLYMGSKEPVLKWLNESGVKTREEAKQKLGTLVQGLFNAGASVGFQGTSFAGTHHVIQKILLEFPEITTDEQDTEILS